MGKPLIGMTAMHISGKQLMSHCTKTAYIDAVRTAGGEVILIPSGIDNSGCDRIMARLDGLLLPGGTDVSPLFYGEQPIKEVTLTRLSDDQFEAAMIQAAIEQKKPILGICRGMQILNAALGGSLYQDIHVQNAACLSHRQDSAIREEGTHTITITQGSNLERIMKSTTALVNSYHHQAVKRAGKGLNITAVADDGIIEACESSDGTLIGVQWHPEGMMRELHATELFRYFVQCCLKQSGRA